MLFVGVDLAWEAQASTGLAVCDGAGRLLAMGTRRTDGELLEWLRPWTAGPCAVGFDAPLVVRNPSGRRECEALVGRYFRARNAGAHPSNLSMPAFADGGRAMRLTRALDLTPHPDPDPEPDVEPDPDLVLDPAPDPPDPAPAGGPAPPSARRAVEVYPHPALVSLFDLPTVLTYKDRPGRTAGHRRGELLRLLDLLEGLTTAPVPLVTAACPAWADTRRAVEQARRKADLDRVEDAVDAVVCAHVVRYAAAAPHAVRYLGGADGGCILTPVTPADAARIDRDLAPARDRGREAGEG